MDAVRVFNGNVRMMFPNSGFISEGFCSGKDEHDGAFIVLRA